MMKKIIIITAFLLGFTALNAQSYTLIAQRYEWLAGTFRALGLPAGDGPAAFQPGQRVRAGAVYYDSTGIDSGLYVYSGLAWKKQGEGGFFIPSTATSDVTQEGANFGYYINNLRSFYLQADTVDITSGIRFERNLPEAGGEGQAPIEFHLSITEDDQIVKSSLDADLFGLGDNTINSDRNFDLQGFVMRWFNGSTEYTWEKQRNKGHIYSTSGNFNTRIETYAFDGGELEGNGITGLEVQTMDSLGGQARLFLGTDSSDGYSSRFELFTHGKIKLEAAGDFNITIGSALNVFGLTTTTDSTDYKPLVQNSSGDVKRFTHWPGGGGGGSDTANLLFDSLGAAGISPVTVRDDTLMSRRISVTGSLTIDTTATGGIVINGTGGGGSTDTTSLSNRINAAYATMAAVNDSTFRLIRPNGTADTIQINSVGSGGSGSGGAGQLYQLILTSGTTWTTPSDITTSTRFKIKGVGGGGGGAGHNTTNGEGSGGGAGGAFEFVVSGLSPSTAYTYAIGAAGAAGDASPSAGGAGGNTTLTIAATTYTANGGGGGATAQGAAGGVGGTATNGDRNIKGQDGAGTGGTASTATGGVPGGTPGLGFGVGGGAVRNSAGSGLPGTGNGAGGGGGTGGAAPGGAGTGGAIIIEYIN